MSELCGYTQSLHGHSIHVMVIALWVATGGNDVKYLSGVYL